jgi:hypothetical protein
MAVYTIALDSTTNFINSLEAAMSSAGILTTTHRKTTTNLIVTTTLSSKPIRITVTAGNYRTTALYGASYSTGDTMESEVTVMGQTQDTPISAAHLIISTYCMILAMRTSTNVVYYYAVLIADDVSATEIQASWNSSTLASYAFNTDSGQAVLFATFRVATTVISSGGNYYSAPLPVMTDGGVLIAAAIKGVTQLLRANDTTWNYQAYGNDVVVNGGNISAIGTAALGVNLLITDGAI